jgi:hypothetical protein
VSPARRHSLTFSIIASGLVLPIIVLSIRQLYINLAIVVEVLNHKPKGYVNYKFSNDQRRQFPLPKEEGFRCYKVVASQLAAQLVDPYQSGHKLVDFFLR